MDDSRAVVQNLVDEYLEATKDTYLQWQPKVLKKKNKENIFMTFNNIILF